MKNKQTIFPNLPNSTFTINAASAMRQTMFTDASRKNLAGYDVSAIIQNTWSAFVAMTDSERSLMLKGLINRSSTCQIEYLCTLLNLKGNKQLEKSAKFHPKEFPETPTSATLFKKSYEKPWLTEKKKPIQLKSNTDLMDQPTISKKISNHDEDVIINSNIYTKLLNSQFDISQIKTQMKLSKPEMTKKFSEFLTDSTQRMQNVMKGIKDISIQDSTEKSLNEFKNNICASVNGKYVTIYILEDSTRDLIVKASNWQAVYKRLSFDSVLCATDVLHHIPRNIFNLKSHEEYTTAIDSIYGILDCECSLSIPIMQGSSKVIGLLEIINKKIGTPFFNSEDEFLANTFSSVCTLIFSNSRSNMDGSIKNPASDGTVNLGPGDVFSTTASLMTSELDLNGLVSEMMKKVQELVSAERCTVFLVDEERKELWSTLTENSSQIRLSMTTGIAGYVATTGEVCNIRDAYSDQRFNRAVDIKSGFKTRTILCMPMRNSKGKIIGVTQIINKLPENTIFNVDDEILLTSFSSLAAVTVEKSVIFKKLQKQLADTINENIRMSTIINSSKCVLMGLDSTGKLIKINHPEVLNLESIMDEVDKECFDQWLGPSPRNQLLIDDIALSYKTTENIHVYNYEYQLQNGTIKFINYSIFQVLKKKIGETKLKDTNFEDEYVDSIVINISEVGNTSRLANNLGRFMKQGLVDRVINNENGALTGASVQATVLSIETDNFASEDSSIPKLLEQLNEYYNSIITCTLKEKGVISSFMGFKAQTVFGIPFVTTDDTLRAVTSAIRIQQEVSTRGKLLPKDQEWTLNQTAAVPITIGICSGSVISGVVGTSERSEYVLLGNACTLSKNMLRVAKTYGVNILIDFVTKEEIKKKFHVREVDIVNFKDVEEPVRVYEVIGPSECELDRDLMTGLICFELGLAEYRQQNWLMAISHFRKATHLIDDRPSKFFIWRCKAILEGKFEVPRTGWDLTWNASDE